jgi:oligopeptide/dipeptide ABC transporter ATP-binding protein
MLPYTAAMLGSVPRADRPRGTVADPIPGSPPNLLEPPAGCPFQPRCFLAREECLTVLPALEEREPGRSAACILPKETVLAAVHEPIETETAR